MVTHGQSRISEYPTAERGNAAFLRYHFRALSHDNVLATKLQEAHRMIDGWQPMSERLVSEKPRIRESSRVLVLNPPKDYERVLQKLPKGAKLLSSATVPVNVLQLFASSQKELQQRLPRLRHLLAPSSILWVTYPKGTSRVTWHWSRSTTSGPLYD